MKKCDICYTPIPPGSDRCPNCGYIYREDLEVSGKKEEKKIADYMKQFQSHPYDTTRKPKPTKLQIPDFKMPTRLDKHDKHHAKALFKTIMWAIAVIVITSVIEGIASSPDIIQNFGTTTNFDDYAELDYEYPDIAEQIYPYYQQIIEETLMSENYSYVYEDYTISDDELKSMQLEAGYQFGDSITMSAIVNTDDYDFWQMQASIIDYDFFNKESTKRSINDQDISEMARLVGCDQQQVLNVYHQLIEAHQDQIHKTFEDFFDIKVTEAFTLQMDLTEETMTIDLINNQAQ